MKEKKNDYFFKCYFPQKLLSFDAIYLMYQKIAQTLNVSKITIFFSLPLFPLIQMTTFFSLKNIGKTSG